MYSDIQLQTVHLFPKIDALLVELLQSLTEEEWHKPTIAKLWRVKDIAAHLLDGNLRTLSIQRDKYFGENPTGIDSYQSLVTWLNQLNADWVKAANRLSPAVLTLLHQLTGNAVSNYYASLDMDAESIFPVSWAGENQSTNRLHVAREYTEKFIHQQQIRDAVNKPALLTKEFFIPFMDTVVHALPNTYKHIEAATESVIQLTVTGEAGDSWFLVRRNNEWQLTKQLQPIISAEIIMPANVAWKLFSKGISPKEARKDVVINGDALLGEPALNMLSFMV